ncbi:MAG TPA: NusG domain II-containing protein [Methylophilaceae bacterium]|nr:NusG domain II-containing protein [Methylophilaceae bacterium]
MPGDWLVFCICCVVVAVLFTTLWHNEAAGKLRIRAGDRVFATLSLDQQRTLRVPGPLGISTIVIDRGRVRVASDPGRHQYCVRQGWLSKAGQVAMCLPNQVSLELLGGEKSYDSLNY